MEITFLETGFSRTDFIQPVAVYRTGFVPWKCCRTNWLFPGAFRSNNWCSVMKLNNEIEMLT